MPKLEDTRRVIEIDLETIKDGKVWVWDGLLARDLEVILEAGEINNIVLVLARLIKDWNLEDENGKKLPIVPENIGKLNVRDIEKILREINLEGIDLKKK